MSSYLYIAVEDDHWELKIKVKERDENMTR